MLFLLSSDRIVEFRGTPRSCTLLLSTSMHCLSPPLFYHPRLFVEKSVLKKKELRERDVIISTAGSREELEQSILVKMKSVTGADEGVCVAMLEENGWELKTSIETFFAQK